MKCNPDSDEHTEECIKGIDPCSDPPEELTTEEVLEKYMSQENMHLEGRRGFEDLCKIARVLGYKDSMYFGALQNGAHIGDLIEFFEDNMGALNAEYGTSRSSW